MRERPDGVVEPVVTPETRAAAMQGLIRERPSASWPVLADAAVPVLLLLATEPEETSDAERRGRRRLPGGDPARRDPLPATAGGTT